MRLFVSPMSPYVRKVRAVAVELGISDRIEVVLCRVRDKTSGLEQLNPFGRVPTLVLSDGSALFDSPVICEYLDVMHGPGRLFPKHREERWIALKNQALGDGMMDAAVPRRDETLRPASEQSRTWIDIYGAMVQRALDLLENKTPSTEVNIGTLSIACALGYLDFRFEADRWRNGRPELAAWYKRFEALDSMVQTKPYQLSK